MKVTDIKFRKVDEHDCGDDVVKVEYTLVGSPDAITRHIDRLKVVQNKHMGLISQYIYCKELMIDTDSDGIVYDPKYSGMLYNGVYIKKVIYNDPATIIIWSDGTKTSSKCQEGDIYNPEMGLLLAYMKKLESSDKVTSLLEEWTPIAGKIDVTLADVRRNKKGPHLK